MTNGEKFKTAQERAEAFRQFCDEGYMKQDCKNCPLVKGSSCDYSCTFAWLDLEAEEEKPLPCPFCDYHQEVVVQGYGSSVGTLYRAECRVCKYQSRAFKTKAEAIAAHNRVAKKCMEGKE